LRIVGFVFFTIRGSSDYDEVRVFSPSFGDLRVKVNDVQRLTSFTLSIRWMAIALGVVAGMTGTPSVKTKPDF
jgi:hypothetical protein